MHPFGVPRGYCLSSLRTQESSRQARSLLLESLTMPDTLTSIIAQLKKKGTEKGRALYARHGMPAERTFGVSIADLKVIAKTIRGQQTLACELYATAQLEAMYLRE